MIGWLGTTSNLRARWTHFVGTHHVQVTSNTTLGTYLPKVPSYIKGRRYAKSYSESVVGGSNQCCLGLHNSYKSSFMVQ